MNKALCIVGAASLAMFLTACDSSVENRGEEITEKRADALEDRADQVRESGESQADAIERSDPGLTDSPSTDRAAEAVREGAEIRADSLEEQADRTREQN